MKAQPAVRRRFGIGLVAVLAALLTSSCAAGQKAQTAVETPAIDGANAKIGTIELHEVAIKTPTANSYPKGATAQVQLAIVNTGSTDDTLIGVSTSAASSTALYASSADAASALAASATATPLATGASSGSGSASAPGSGSASGSVPGSGSASASAPGSASGSASASASGSASASASASSSPSGPQSLTSLAVPAGQLISVGINSADRVLVLVDLTGALYPAMQVTISFDFKSAGTLTMTVPVQLSDTSTITPLVVPSSTLSP